MQVSCMILSGGRATRMGGIDKGLIELRKKSLIEHAIERIAPQVNELLINANRSLEKYSTFNTPVYQDETADFIGPLAGFKLALTHAKHELILIVPCDSPFLPNNLVSTLISALVENKAEIVVARSDGNVHPVICLCKKSVLPSLIHFIASGQRKVSAWQKSLIYAEADFSNPNTIDSPNINPIKDTFLNLNTPEELNTVELLFPYPSTG